jgi:hypothetical protein
MIISNFGSGISSPLRLSAIVRSDKVAVLIGGDGEIEESELVPEGISGVDDGRVGVRDCSPTPESPGEAAMEVAAVSWDVGTVASGFALRRVGG